MQNSSSVHECNNEDFQACEEGCVQNEDLQACEEGLVRKGCRIHEYRSNICEMHFEGFLSIAVAFASCIP